jgi:aryl-alcohol dehydrogenase-like predicted oxidoreductase
MTNKNVWFITGAGRGMGLDIAKAALAAGSRSFDSSDFRNTVPRFTPEARKANQAMVDLLSTVAERKKATPAQIALAWLLAQKPWIVPIPGTTKLHRLEENLDAVSIELTSDDVRELNDASSKITVQVAHLNPRKKAPYI